MITAAWLIFKSFISKVIDVFMRYPLQIILILVCIYAFWQKTRYDAIVSEFDTYKLEILQASKMQQLKNDILRKQAEASLKDAQLTYDNNLKAIKNEYLKKQKIDSITIVDLRNKLREAIAADSFTLPDTSAYSSESADQWRNGYTTIARQYETLIDACRLTTNDYNLLRDWADAACNQIGCK